ncbi:HK97 gp10 family phage protein [Microbacteriaceae bacterium VKM Ac-2854]|nr:HK97 gp10 family phage protein [Microbacteriaceae bacterium VKM Ac-2854]
MSEEAIRIEGWRELRSTLRKAGDDLSDLKQANADAAKIAAEASAQLAPSRSGRLAATIRSAGTKAAGVIRAGTARVPYALPIHWGWGRRHIAANPFLSRGARNSEGQWIRVYEDFITDTVIHQINGK